MLKGKDESLEELAGSDNTAATTVSPESSGRWHG